MSAGDLAGIANDFLPKRSATLPKKSRKAPELSEVAEEIHVISAVVIPRSRPMKLDTTVTDPVSKAPIAMAIVAVSTKSTSWIVEEKHAGRTLFVVTGSR